ncbi:MAG: TonB-dependent receptor domain-containing protein [Wolinella sp.]
MHLAFKHFLVANLTLGTLLAAQGEKSFALEEVKVTSATGFEQNIKDAPASISIITGEELKKRNHQDIENMIKDIPGVFGATLGAASRRGITMRGLGQKYTKILIDGRPATSDSAYKGLRAVGSSQNFLPPANTIERIEVIRGPMSSLYGSDAMGGIINIITKGFSNEFHGNLNGYYTYADRSKISNDFQGGYYLSGALVPDTLGVALYGKYFKKNEDTLAYGNRENDDMHHGIKFIYNASQNDEITLDYRNIKNEFERTAGKTLSTSGTNNDLAYEEMKGYTTSLAHVGRYRDLLLDSYATFDQIQEEGQQKIKLKTTTINSKGTYFFDSNTLTLGAMYRHEKLDEEATTADEANVNRWDLSGYIEDEFRATENLNFTAGLRYNHDKDYGAHLSPRFYTVYHLDNSFSLKGGISTGYSTPDIKQRTDNLALAFAGGHGAQLGRSELKPERSVSYEAGFSYDDNQNINVSAIGFFTDMRDGISTSLSCRPTIGKPCVHKGKTYRRGIWNTVNVGKSEIKGLEASGDFRINPSLTLHASYTYTKSVQKSGNEQGHTLNNLPVHTIKFGVDYDVSDNFNIWSQMNYIGETKHPMSYDQSIDNYLLVDIGASYKIAKNMSINATFYNIGNEFVTTRSGRYDMLIVDGAKAQVGFSVDF